MLILKQWKWKVSHQSIHLIRLQFIFEDLSRENVLSMIFFLPMNMKKIHPQKQHTLEKLKKLSLTGIKCPNNPNSENNVLKQLLIDQLYIKLEVRSKKSGQHQNFKRLLAKRKAVILANSIASQVQPFPGCCRTMGGKPTKTPQIVQYFFRVRSKRGVIFRILNGFWPSERRFVASQVQPFPGCCRTMGGKPTKTPQIVQYFFRVRSKRGVIFRILNGFWPSERRFVASQVQPFPGCCRTMGRKPTSQQYRGQPLPRLGARCRRAKNRARNWSKIGYCYKKGSPMSDVQYSSSILIMH